MRETDGILGSLRSRAARASIALSAMRGISCQAIEGAMYAFPSIEMPARLVDDSLSRILVPSGLMIPLMPYHDTLRHC